jgi:ribosomal protein L18E
VKPSSKSNQKLKNKIENWKSKSASNRKITAPVEKPKLKYFHVPMKKMRNFLTQSSD